MSLRTVLRRPRTWLIAVPVLVLLVAVVGPFVYINFVQERAPARLTLGQGSSTSTTVASGGASGSGTTSTTLDGTWNVTSGSQAGYRVKEILFGQDAEAVGRTRDVSGSLIADGTTVTDASFTVDMATVASNESRRDRQFKGRIMDVATYPRATFELSEPISVESMPADGEQATVTVSGRFTIRGVTRDVTFEVTARRSGSKIEVNGTIPVAFADYEIPDASFGPATVQNHGEIEFLLTFMKA